MFLVPTRYYVMCNDAITFVEEVLLTFLTNVICGIMYLWQVRAPKPRPMADASKAETMSYAR